MAYVAMLGRAISAWAIDQFGRKTLVYLGYGVGGAAAIGLMFVHNVFVAGMHII